MQTTPTRVKGLTIAVVGVLFILPDALLVKITSVDPVVFLFWRGLLLAISFLLVSAFRYRGRLVGEIRQCGKKGIYCAVAFSLSTLGFVMGMKNTAAGNVLVILNMAPMGAMFRITSTLPAAVFFMPITKPNVLSEKATAQ